MLLSTFSDNKITGRAYSAAIKWNLKLNSETASESLDAFLAWDWADVLCTQIPTSLGLI